MVWAASVYIVITSLYPKILEKNYLDLVALATRNLGIWEIEAGGSLKFKNSQGYVEKPKQIKQKVLKNPSRRIDQLFITSYCYVFGF